VGANIEPHEDQAHFVRRAFDLIARGRYRKTDVLKMVTDEGLTTSKGKCLTPQTFQAVLRNRLYAGWVTLASDEQFEPVRDLHEPLVTQETFDRVQAVLDGRRPGSAPKCKLNPSSH
jgi:hypothetical protein